MKKLESSLSTLAVASVLASGISLVACSHNQAPAQPPTVYENPSASAQQPGSQYGSAMNQTSPTEPTAPSNPPTGSTEEMGNQPSAQPYQGMQNAPSGASTQYGASSSQPMGAMDVSGMDDAQFASILMTLNQSSIQEAQLAETKATSPEVKRLANHIAMGHQRQLTKDQELFSSLQITPADNAVSQRLQSHSTNQMSSLQSMSGSDFDKAFVNDQIMRHNHAIELMDRMMPNVKNPQFKADLQDQRNKMQDHLQEIERVQQKLQGSTNQQPNYPEQH